MERIATDTYSFDRIREGGFVHVNKTSNDAEMRNLSDRAIEEAINVV